MLLHRTFRSIGTPYLFPPGTPKDRIETLTEALRATFTAAATDAAFLNDFKKLTGAEATPLTAEEQAKAIKEIPRDRETIEVFKKIAGGDPLPRR